VQNNATTSATNGFTAGIGFSSTRLQGGSIAGSTGLSQSLSGAGFNVLGGALLP